MPAQWVTEPPQEEGWRWACWLGGVTPVQLVRVSWYPKGGAWVALRQDGTFAGPVTAFELWWSEPANFPGVPAPGAAVRARP